MEVKYPATNLSYKFTSLTHFPMAWSFMNKMTVRTWASRAKGRLYNCGYPMKVRCSRNPISEKPVTRVYDFSLGNTLIHSVAPMKLKRAWLAHPPLNPRTLLSTPPLLRLLKSQAQFLVSWNSHPKLGLKMGSRIHKEASF